MKHWKTGLFLGLALLSLALPARAAALPEDLESALPRDAGKLLDGVEQWDGESLPEGLSSIWNHLRDDAAEILRRQTRGAVSVLLVVLLCGAAEGFRKSAGASERFLPMAGTLAVTALTAGSLDTLMGVGAAAMERIHTFSQTLLPALAAVSALSGGVAGAAVRQIAAVFFANLLLELIRGLLMPMVYLYAGTLAAGGSLSDKRLSGSGGTDPDGLRPAADSRAAGSLRCILPSAAFSPAPWTAPGCEWPKPPSPAWCRWWGASSPRPRKPYWPGRGC